MHFHFLQLVRVSTNSFCVVYAVTESRNIKTFLCQIQPSLEVQNTFPVERKCRSERHGFWVGRNIEERESSYIGRVSRSRCSGIVVIIELEDFGDNQVELLLKTRNY